MYCISVNTMFDIKKFDVIQLLSILAMFQFNTCKCRVKFIIFIEKNIINLTDNIDSEPKNLDDTVGNVFIYLKKFLS